MSDAPLTLGTAGHIDHGKTALIAALTGVDTDRLPEEHERGISIELGYASMTLDGGARLSVIDVPGHERYVRTMVAGATGNRPLPDDDRRRRRRHAPDARARGGPARARRVARGRRGDQERSRRPRAGDARSRRAAARRRGGRRVRADRRRVSTSFARRWPAWSRRSPAAPTRPGAARLHVDRVFTIKGAGTVVTGTLWSGSIARGDSLMLLPGPAARAGARGAGPRRRRRARGRRTAGRGQPQRAVRRRALTRRRRRRTRRRSARDLSWSTPSSSSRATPRPRPAYGSRSTTGPGSRPRG